MPHGIKLTSVWLHLHLSVYSSSRRVPTTQSATCVSHSVCIGQNTVSMIIWIHILSESCMWENCCHSLLLHHLEEAAICGFVWETARLAGLFKCFHSEPLHLSSGRHHYNLSRIQLFWSKYVQMNNRQNKYELHDFFCCHCQHTPYFCNAAVVVARVRWVYNYNICSLGDAFFPSSSQSAFQCEGSSSAVWNLH